MARERIQGILQFVGLVAVCTALGYGAWLVISRPKMRPGQTLKVIHVDPAHDSVGFVSVAGDAVDLEVVDPAGAHAATRGVTPGMSRIAGSESSVDCPGFSGPDGKESDCTASINVKTPHIGVYSVIARSPQTRAVTLNVGWATASQAHRGAFYVRIQVAAGGATQFLLDVTREGVTQKSEPRPVTP